MDWLTRAERKLGRWAIADLTLYLVAGQGIAFILGLTVPGFLEAIQLEPPMVLQGQWWRVLTFVFTPPSFKPLFAAFALYLLYFMGGALEQHWGTFRYNLYFAAGYLVTVATAFVFGLPWASNTYLTGSIFLAFAFLFPNYEFVLFFVLPVKVKWLALLTWLGYAFQLVMGGWTARLLVLAAVANFLLFFARDLFHLLRYGQRRLNRKIGGMTRREQPRHVCAACGVSDLSDRSMEFRYCSKCDPPRPYCMAHLRTHEHVPAQASSGS